MEQWKPIKGFEDRYEVSDLGRVRSVDWYEERIRPNGDDWGFMHKGRIISVQIDKRGYAKVCLSKNGVHKYPHVHTLVANAFCNKPEGAEVVDHINENKSDNRASNLEWVTQKENVQRAWKTGTANTDRIRKVIICKETGEIFSSSVEAATMLNNTKYGGKKHVRNMSRKIRASILGYSTQAYGFHWANYNLESSTTSSQRAYTQVGGNGWPLDKEGEDIV